MATIYLSSTYEDLKEHRRVVFDVLKKSGHEVKAMEDYVASDQRPVDKCLKDVAEADIYVGIFGFRYGYIPPPGDNPDGLSITELELRHAETLQKPCLIFLLNENMEWPQKFVDAASSPEKGERIKKLRYYLAVQRAVSYFSLPEELAAVIQAAVSGVAENLPRRESATESIANADSASAAQGVGEAATMSEAPEPAAARSNQSPQKRSEEPNISAHRTFRLRRFVGRAGRIASICLVVGSILFAWIILIETGWTRLNVSATTSEESQVCGSAPGSGPEMLLVRGGTFNMAHFQGQGVQDELPVRSVAINTFAIGVCEVTFDEYDLFAKATKRKLPDDSGWARGRRPVINVSWEDAQAYAKWLSEQTGKRYRLPSEAEWEYAARAGTKSEYWWGDNIGRGQANCDGCGTQWDNKQTAPVGSFKPNSFGLHDTAGNVWEWVEDCWHLNYDGAPTDGRAWGQENGGDCGRRVIRGGSWNYTPWDLRSSTRFWSTAGTRDDLIGFRLAQDLN